MRLRFGRVAFFVGVGGRTVTGWILMPVTLPGSTAEVLLSSTVGLGEAMTCCDGGGAEAGSVSPPEAAQAP